MPPAPVEQNPQRSQQTNNLRVLLNNNSMRQGTPAKKACGKRGVFTYGPVSLPVAYYDLYIDCFESKHAIVAVGSGSMPLCMDSFDLKEQVEYILRNTKSKWVDANGNSPSRLATVDSLCTCEGFHVHINGRLVPLSSVWQDLYQINASSPYNSVPAEELDIALDSHASNEHLESVLGLLDSQFVTFSTPVMRSFLVSHISERMLARVQSFLQELDSSHFFDCKDTAAVTFRRNTVALLSPEYLKK